MFTGIVTDVGEVVSAEQRGDLPARIATGYDLATVDLGASIACSGVCLTVVDKGDDWFAVDVSGETVSGPRPIAGARGAGSTSSARCGSATSSAGISSPGTSTPSATWSARARGRFAQDRHQRPRTLAPMIAPKGSITLDGVSLTVNDVRDAEDGRPISRSTSSPHGAEHDTWRTQPGNS
jgi:riboflavin synthase